MRRASVLGVLLAVGGLSIAVAAYQQGQGQGRAQGPNVAEIQKVKENLYMITGGGGNTAAFVTANGVVVVDTKNPGWGQAILDKIKTVTDKPVTMIINTHTHPDHTSSNSFFGATVEIVAHENTKTNMEKLDLFKGDGSKFLPSKTYKDKLTLLSGKDRIDLFFFGPGHTNGDTWVVFPAINAMHAGDMFPSKYPPYMDAASGGVAFGYSQTLAKALSTIKGVDTVIGGHHPTPITWADLQEYEGFVKEFVAGVETSLKSGKSVDDVAAAWTVPDKYKDKGYTLGSRVKGDVQVIADEIKKK
jgi:glyoxylase-like metal-dependent hydrolase (beta-lactamase superfamily II)